MTTKKSPTTPHRLLYSRAETAELLGVPVRLLKRWQLAGKLRATKPGGVKGQVFFTRAEIERFLKDFTS
ncbi:helix-turn-helix domain-containing protein [Nocardioides sp. cx-173]|uniref:helix-turn-helix domain-containing protein n=1 Tax=Nocardioides sp. cx-173 TaxID=2898796 RepID=UPI001E5782A8|nr:helix-turn-helix domain-containing protein [Nocardioides sp. cx-173]MCD4527458.1 helix-turn-helix domain-containing protein [Nocardioides sp. cx-173]UGB40402.1 helix-turn-helix domain-containing protein [Nocardioides sp. cx-173]